MAATSAIGSFMVPEMKKQGYDVNYSAAVTAAAADYWYAYPSEQYYDRLRYRQRWCVYCCFVCRRLFAWYFVGYRG